MFPSGFDHLHRVCPVTSGNRFALAIWFTFTESSSEGALPPAHYEVVDPVPPPSAEEIQIDSVCLDRLREQVERLMAMGIER